jgi:hypothetical protein
VTSPTTPAKRAGRLLSPAGFALAGILFSLPFIAVSCEAPGGFGRATAGGTTVYRGFDLVTGAAPSVTPDHLRPIAQQQPDALPVQLLAVAALVLIVAGLVTTMALRLPGPRRAVAGLIAALAALALSANQATVHTLLESRLREQLTEPMPEGRTAADFVQNQGGFWACVAVLGLLAAGNALGRLRARKAVAGFAAQEAVPMPLAGNLPDAPPGGVR